MRQIDVLMSKGSVSMSKRETVTVRVNSVIENIYFFLRKELYICFVVSLKRHTIPNL